MITQNRHAEKLEQKRELIQGNEACALAALYSGCSFYAGYPITPSSEIMEILGRELPKRDGVFIQMEDEIASLAAVIGASWAGAKAMTATSGPGFSLMQENLGYAAITGTPCVIVDSQRWGPSTGQPTKTSQGDVMQARWGTHGDHPIIVLTASSVRDIFEMTVNAFNFSEKFRVPVILLLDEVVSHMREGVVLPQPGELEVINRRTPHSTESFRPHADESFLPMGSGVRFNVTGMAHDDWGFPVQGHDAEILIKSLMQRIELGADQITLYNTTGLEESAKTLIVSFGITSRATQRAIELLRAQGELAAVVDLKTLWPFPEKILRSIVKDHDIAKVLVVELNLGQIVREVERVVKDIAVVEHLGRSDGYLITPEQIATKVAQMGGVATHV